MHLLRWPRKSQGNYMTHLPFKMQLHLSTWTTQKPAAYVQSVHVTRALGDGLSGLKNIVDEQPELDIRLSIIYRQCFYKHHVKVNCVSVLTN